MITLEEIDGLVRRQLRGKLPADRVLAESTQLDDLGLSSLQISEIVFTLEEDHDVEFDTARAAEVKTLGDVLALANEALAAAGTDAYDVPAEAGTT